MAWSIWGQSRPYVTNNQEQSIAAYNKALKAQAKDDEAKRGLVKIPGSEAKGRFGEGRYAVPLVAGSNSHTQQIRRVVSKTPSEWITKFRRERGLP